MSSQEYGSVMRLLPSAFLDFAETTQEGECSVMEQIDHPTKEQVRAWLKVRQTSREPLPGIDKIQQVLCWKLRQTKIEESESRWV